MKHFISILFLTVATLTVSAQQVAQLSGCLEGIKSDTIVISLVNDQFNNIELTDTIAMNNGVFNYTLPVSKARFGSLRGLPCAAQPEVNGMLDIVLLPGQHGILNGTLANCKFSGTAFYQEWARAYAVINPLKQEAERKSLELYKQMEQQKDNDSLKVALKEMQEQMQQRINEAALEYIKNHPDEDASVMMTVNVYDRWEEALSLLSDKAKQGQMAPMVKALTDMVARYKARFETAKLVGEGKSAPDFTLNDIHNKPFALSSLRGKYVVLDFWGSWCGWCIKGMPKMKEYYQKYKDKMEIVGIDCNDTEIKWKNAVEKHQLPWIHVKNEDENSVLVKYAVEAFPTKIIINPDGVIVKVIVGESADFYTYLDTALQK